MTVKIDEIVKKITEDPGQDECKTKIKAQLIVNENLLPFIEEEPAEAGNVTPAELELMDEEYQTMIKDSHNPRQIQESLNKKIKMLNI